MSRQRSEGELDRLAERTEGDLDRLADELERGEAADVKVRRGPGRPPLGSGPAQAIRVRLPPDLRRELGDRARAQGVTDSELVRDALRSYLGAS